MTLNRRAFAATAAAAFAAPFIMPRWARAASAYQRAAEYSAAHRGISMLVMKSGRVAFEDYPNA